MTEKLPPIPDEYEAQVEHIQGRAYETGEKVGRREAFQAAAHLVDLRASEAFLANNEDYARRLRELAQAIRKRSSEDSNFG